MKETKLGELVIEWLQRERPGWEIFQEIQPRGYGSIADIVCINKADLVWIIELKTTLNLAVIRQAYSWHVDYRSIAVISAKRQASIDERNWWYRYMKFKMQIGTISVSPFGLVSEKYSPDIYNYINDKVVEKILEICKSGKTDGFGVAGGQDGGHWTPYKESMKSVQEFVQNNPGCQAMDIVSALGKLHYANDHSARTNLAKNLIAVEKWCEVKKRGSVDTFYVKEDK